MLGRRASFWVATAVVAHTLWTSAAPAMTYRLYASEWNLTHTATTAIFAVFPIVVVAVLILSGDLSDYIGRRATILIGLTSSLLGTALFAVAPSVLWVFVGRAFMGLGVALCPDRPRSRWLGQRARERRCHRSVCAGCRRRRGTRQAPDALRRDSRRRPLGDSRHRPVGVIDHATRASHLRRRGNSGRDWLPPDVFGWPELDQCQRACRSPWRRVIRALR